jgi:hypothetical protein
MQTQKRGILARAVDETKIGLSNNARMQARNAANSAWVDVIGLDTSDRPSFGASPYVGANKIIDESQKGAANGVAALDGSGKIPAAQLPIDTLIYKGTWDASSNTPTLANGTGTSGFFYYVNVAGTVDFGAGNISFVVGDWVLYNGTIWEKAHSGTDLVASVNGQTGTVVLTTTNIAEGTNLYFTNARAIGATLTGYAAGAGTVTSADSILTALEKLDGNIQAVSGLSSGQESLTLNGTDITNQYKDLAQTVKNGSLTIECFGVVQVQNTDYTLSVVAGKTRVTFAGDLATGGPAALISGDVLNAQYLY